MNNYNFENRNYNKKRYTLWQYIAAAFSLLLDYLCESEKIAAGVRLGAITLGVALVIGIVGGVELGTVSVTVGAAVCISVLVGFLIFGEDR